MLFGSITRFCELYTWTDLLRERRLLTIKVSLSILGERHVTRTGRYLGHVGAAFISTIAGMV